MNEEEMEELERLRKENKQWRKSNAEILRLSIKSLVNAMILNQNKIKEINKRLNDVEDDVVEEEIDRMFS